MASFDILEISKKNPAEFQRITQIGEQFRLLKLNFLQKKKNKIVCICQKRKIENRLIKIKNYRA